MQLNLLAWGRLAGRCRAVELELHEQLGSLVPGLTDPAVKIALAGAAMAHGWRAGLFAPLLPVSVGLPAGPELVRLPGSTVGDLLGSATDSRLPPLALLDGLVEVVYPAMLDGYRAFGSLASGPGDGPLVLAARRAADDLANTLGDGKELLSRLAGDEWGAGEAATTRNLRDLLPATGGIFELDHGES